MNSSEQVIVEDLKYTRGVGKTMQFHLLLAGGIKTCAGNAAMVMRIKGGCYEKDSCGDNRV